MPRRPLPTKLKLLRGNAGKRKLNRREPAPPAGIPSCPKHLRGRARATWRRFAEQLATLGVATQVDEAALELLVRSYVDYDRAQRVLDRCGQTYTIRTASGRVVRPRPEVRIAADAARRVKSMLTEFGLTPAARARVEMEPPASVAKNDVEQFLFRDRP